MRFISSVMVHILGLAALLFAVTPEPGGQPMTPSAAGALNLVPWPQSVSLSGGEFTLQGSARIIAQEASLKPLARLLSQEIQTCHWLALAADSGLAGAGDIGLALDSTQRKQQYRLLVSDRIVVSGGSYQAVAQGTVTLLQALQRRDGMVRMPRLVIHDEPDAEYRGVLIDVGRKWHPIPGLKDLITMCRMYKVNFIQLHLTDNELFTFPSRIFPTLPSMQGSERRHYSWEELVDLVQFADQRGVTLVPELETPGHSAILRKVAPFGRPGLSAVNMASEEVYTAFDKLIGEMCSVFRSTPYFHIGTDEAIMEGQGTTSADRAYMSRHGLSSISELFDHHIIRLNQIVKKHGKTTIRWGGFGGSGSSADKIPADIIHMAWQMRGNGTTSSVPRKIINASWKPLYVVNQKSWLPKYLLDTWHIRMWQFHMDNNRGQYLAPNVPVFGAQMCAWEQPPEAELPSLRWRLPAMCERIYNQDSGRSYADFKGRFEATDRLLDHVFNPVDLQASGLSGDPADRAFTGALTIRLSGAPNHVIRYTVNGTEPNASSPAYTGPFTVNAADVRPENYIYSKPHGHYLKFGPRLHVKMVQFSASGAMVGQVRDDIFYAVEPRARVKIYYSPKMADHTQSDWGDARDWERMGLQPNKEAVWPDLVFGMPSSSRGAPFLPMASGVVSKGRLNIPRSGTYAFAYVEDGGEVYINGTLVTKSTTGMLNTIALRAGLHDIEVRYTFSSIFDWGTQSVLFAELTQGQSLAGLLDPPKTGKLWKRPKPGLWKKHSEILTLLDGTVPPPPPPGPSDDRTPPSQPAGLRETGKSAASVSLAWNAATDNSGIVHYDIYVNGARAGGTDSLVFTAAGLSSNTEYAFAVKARDNSGNNSPSSTELRVKTLQGSVPPPPEPQDFTTKTLEAEQARVVGAMVMPTYVDYINTADDYIEWTIDLPADGSFDLAFKYSLGGSARFLKISDNDRVLSARLEFGQTQGWKAYRSKTIRVELKKGLHKIRATAIGTSGPNMDSLTVTRR